MEAKIIKTEEEYRAALAEVERLVDLDSTPGTPDGDKAELLITLVQAYEAKQFPIAVPDPITAIQFRMEQQNLTQNDLIPYLGSRSRASEVLSGKRPLSLSMIRALHYGLGIPAAVLLQKQSPGLPQEVDVEWRKFPVKEMVKRGWIKATSIKAENIREVVEGFCSRIMPSPAMATMYLKKDHIRSRRSVDPYALAAWSTRILILAQAYESSSYRPGLINMGFLRDVAQMSSAQDGPLQAVTFLRDNGIAVVVEEHLPKTYMDGAAMLAPWGQPVIGLTLRHDRIDNFWYVLMHELIHVWRHVVTPSSLFFDDLDEDSDTDRQEKEADDLAREALIPRTAWEKSHARILRSPEAAKLLANELGIHPAIVAGRIRRETKNYRILNQVIGLGEVKPLFAGATV